MADSYHSEEETSHRNEEREPVFPKDTMDISDQISRALEAYTPLIVRKLNETLEGAMNDHLARMIREEVAIAVQEEFIKRDSTSKSGDGGEKVVEPEVTPPKVKFSYKDFTICRPMEFNGEVDPIICTRWISEIEGTFRTSQCPNYLKVPYAVSMLRKKCQEMVGWVVEG